MASSSNRKEAPAEPFKRVLGLCVRAIAGDGEVQVSYAPGKPERPLEGLGRRLLLLGCGRHGAIQLDLDQLNATLAALSGRSSPKQR